jgi:uncharacterized protein YdaU (DUF1376 family)
VGEAAQLPEPLTPPDCDLRDLDGFMLNVERLLASELWALSTGEEFKSAVALWCRAWKQVPAGSLPADKRVIASFAGMTKESLVNRHWHTVMRGFVLCSDGRWYHRTLCEDALRAWKMKRRRADDRNADSDRLKRWRERRNNGGETPHETPHETSTKHVRQGQGQGQGQKERTPQPPASGGVAFPDWWPNDAWQSFVAHRKNLRKRLTDDAIRLILKHLSEWRQKGHDPATALNTSIENGWTGIFEPKQAAPLLPLNGSPTQYADPRYFKPNEPAAILKLPEPRPGTPEYRGYMEAEMGRWADFPDDCTPGVRQ